MLFSSKRKLTTPLGMTAVCWLCMLVGVDANGAPVLEVVPAECDFGRQAVNKQEYPFEFILKNTGDELLVIEDVRAGCGCTKVELQGTRIEAGSQQKLTGVLTTKHFEGRTGKSILLKTNEEGRSIRILRLNVMLPYSQTGLRFYPRNITWFRARPFRDTFRALINVENCNAEGALKILTIQLPEGWTCETELPLVVEPESRSHLIVTRPLGDGEPFPDQEFVLKTTCEEAPTMRAALRCYIPERRTAIKETREEQNQKRGGEG